MLVSLSFLYRVRFVVLLVLVLLWAGAFTITHIPPGDVPDLSVGDKTLHVVGFVGLGGWLWLCCVAFGARRLERAALVIALTVTYGIADEYTQQFVGRSTEFGDLFCDIAGACAAVLLGEVLLPIVFKRAPAAGGEDLKSKP